MSEQDATFLKKPQLTSVCFYCAMCEVVVRGLWNVFHKVPLMGSSLWNTNGSSLRYSKWYKFGLIVVLFALLSFFFSSILQSSHRTLSLCVCIIVCVCAKMILVFFWLQ